jgi:DNA-binding CsgD family transcriptional regulator
LGIGVSGLTEAVEAGLLSLDESMLRFRHPLLRSVAHQTARPDEVRRMHVALADTLTDQDQRAWHLAMAATGPDEEAAAGLERSAHRALEKGAAASAAAAFRRAAGLSADRMAKVQRLEAGARAAHRAGNMTLTASLIEQVWSLTGPAHSNPAMFLLDADIRMRRGDFAGASATLRLEATRIAGHHPERAATMLLVAAKLRVYRFEAAAALTEVGAALALIPEGELDVVHLTAVAMASTMAGSVGAREAVHQAMEAAIASPHGHTHTLGIGWPLVWLEEYDLARSFIARSVAIQRKGGFLSYLPQALLAMAELDFRTGHWDQARIDAHEALRLFEESQQPTEAAIASAFLARLEAACGEEQPARAHAAAAHNSDARSGLRAATAYAAAALGVLEMGRAKYPEAIEHFEAADAIVNAGGIGEPWLLPLEADLAEALTRNGDPVRALEVAEASVKAARAAGRRSALAAGLRATGLALPDKSFDEAFDEAIAIHQQVPTPFELARTLLCFGERLRRTKARVEARRQLRQALSIFEMLGAEPWSARSRAELAASGETLERSHSHARLTPQERQVATIVASGATNREAAATLFVNAKTIEFHLGNIYRKLGVRSRTELANALRPPTELNLARNTG